MRRVQGWGSAAGVGDPLTIQRSHQTAGEGPSCAFGFPGGPDQETRAWAPRSAEQKGRWSLASGPGKGRWPRLFQPSVQPLLPAAGSLPAALPPPGNPEAMHLVLLLGAPSPGGRPGAGQGDGAASGQPPLTIGVQGQQAGGAEHLHMQLLLRGAVGRLDGDCPKLLRGGFRLRVGHRGSVSWGRTGAAGRSRYAVSAAEGSSLTCCWMRLQKYFRMSSRLEAACSSKSLCRAWEWAQPRSHPNWHTQSQPSAALREFTAKWGYVHLTQKALAVMGPRAKEHDLATALADGERHRWASQVCHPCSHVASPSAMLRGTSHLV